MAIVVVNRTDSEFSDRFNGQDFLFPVGKKILISEDAARHIFGLGESDKRPYFSRLGWLRTQADLEAAEARLARFQFSAFDPYAQLNDDPDPGPTEQRLSPVADDEATPTASDGTEGVAAAAGPSKKGGILDKLQGAAV